MAAVFHKVVRELSSLRYPLAATRIALRGLCALASCFYLRQRPDFYGNTAQFPPYGLSTVSAAAARHLRCQNARQYTKYCLRFWLSICRTSLAISALRIMRYCPYTSALARRVTWQLTLTATGRQATWVGSCSMQTPRQVVAPPKPCGPKPVALMASNSSFSSAA